MSSVILTGDTSGTLTVSAPLVAGTNTLTLAAATGTLSPLVSATAVTASGTSIDFTSIPSWAKRITVMFYGVSTSGTSALLIQLGDSGGVENTGYASLGYQVNTTPTGTSATSTAGYVIGASASAAANYTGIFTICLISSNTWVLSGTGTRQDSGTLFSGSGSKALSDVLDRVRLTTVNGTDTFDAGTINIIYEG